MKNKIDLYWSGVRKMKTTIPVRKTFIQEDDVETMVNDAFRNGFNVGREYERNKALFAFVGLSSIALTGVAIYAKRKKKSSKQEEDEN